MESFPDCLYFTQPRLPELEVNSPIDARTTKMSNIKSTIPVFLENNLKYSRIGYILHNI